MSAEQFHRGAANKRQRDGDSGIVLVVVTAGVVVVGLVIERDKEWLLNRTTPLLCYCYSGPPLHLCGRLRCNNVT